MNPDVVLATARGVVACSYVADGWQETGRSLPSSVVTSIMAREGVILAGTTDGIFRSQDRGRSWVETSVGLAARHVRWLAYHPSISDREFAGTEPAGIFVSGDGGDLWHTCPEVEQLRDRHRWFLPYSPEAGCVRDFAFGGNRVYAAVEVGGVLRSDDAGATWRLVDGSTGEPDFSIPPPPLVHPDVHSVASHPSSPDLVVAVTAEGLYRSLDGGATWTVSHAGSYCRAVWVHPADPDHLVLGPARSVARKDGRIEESLDGGRSWTPASGGLDLPWPDTMVERFTQLGTDLCAITNDGRVYVTSESSMYWRRVFAGIPAVNALATVDPAAADLSPLRP